MKIFFDTNIFIDILLDRKFELNESLKIFENIWNGLIMRNWMIFRGNNYK